MDEFRDSDISSLLNQVAGSSPDTMTAHKAVLGKVRRVRQRRVMTVSTAAVVMVVSGAVAMVQNSDNRGGGSNIAVPLSPGDSQPIKVATTIGLSATTTTIEGSISIEPVVTDPPTGTPSTQPSSDSTTPDNSSVAPTTSPTNTQVPSNSQSPSTSTIPANTSSPSTTKPPATTPPTTKAPIVTTPPTTQAPISPPPFTFPPVTVPEIKTWSCRGGSVKYQVTSSGLVVVETIPDIGFKVSESKAKAAEIAVKFIPTSKGDGRKSSLKIKNSRIVSTSCDDEDFDRRSDSEDSGSTNNNDESADD
jgi:hypothetical protein